MTSKVSSNANVYIAAPVNDDAQTSILGLDNSNNVKYRTASTITGTYNQSLNTTSNVTFNSVTTGAIYAPINTINIINSNISYIIATAITSNATATTIFTLATATNTDYIMYAEVSAFDVTSNGGASFLVTTRITNNGGVLENGNLESVSNKTASNSISAATVTVTTSGTTALVNVTGIAAQTVNWTALLRIISTS
jgi:hypothetical protein